MIHPEETVPLWKRRAAKNQTSVIGEEQTHFCRFINEKGAKTESFHKNV
jgi:hypothetical protein